MEKEKKMQVATFRFGVISDFVGGANLSRGEKERRDWGQIFILDK